MFFLFVGTKIIKGRKDFQESERKAQKEAEHRVHAIKIDP